MELVYYFDGGNEGGTAVWAFVCQENDRKTFYADYVSPNLPQTNNVAEWSALLNALENALARADEIEEAIFYGDSELVIKQMRGAYACKQPHLVPLFNRCRQIHNELTIDRNVKCEYQHIRREFNKEADQAGRDFRNHNTMKINGTIRTEGNWR